MDTILVFRYENISKWIFVYSHSVGEIQFSVTPVSLLLVDILKNSSRAVLQEYTISKI